MPQTRLHNLLKRTIPELFINQIVPNVNKSPDLQPMAAHGQLFLVLAVPDAHESDPAISKKPSKDDGDAFTVIQLDYETTVTDAYT